MKGKGQTAAAASSSSGSAGVIKRAKQRLKKLIYLGS
jgi:hypothetical protein